MTDFKMRDTVPFQIQSVANFMLSLGYVIDTSVETGRFVNMNPYSSANRHIGYATATKLHNSETHDFGEITEGTYLHLKTNLSTGFTKQAVMLAFASKLVEKSKVQLDRKGRVILNNENALMVKPLSVFLSQALAD